MTAIDPFAAASDRLAQATVRRFRRVVMVGSAGAAVVALAGLIGYISGIEVLGSIRLDWKPMAPSTALSFLVLAGILARHARTPFSSSALKVACALVSLITLFSLLAVVGIVTGTTLTLEDRLFPGATTLNGMPVERMSILTGATFLVAGPGILLCLLRCRGDERARRLGDVASSLGAVTMLIGGTDLLAYLYATPLLYGGTMVAMAATTAVAFVFLGVALVAAPGPESYPLRLLTGDSTNARLSRALLPLVAALVLLQGVIAAWVDLDDSAAVALQIVVVVLLATLMVARTVRSVGSSLDDLTRKARQSEEWHQAIVETAMDGFWLVDAQAHLLEVNDTYCRMSGYDRQELLTMRISDLEAIETEVDIAVRQQNIVQQREDRFQSRHRRKDGSTFDVEVSVQSRPIEGGRFVVFVQDITERKTADAAIRQMALVLDAAPNSITVHDSDGRFLYANPRTFELHGYTRDEFLALNLRQVDIPSDAALIAVRMQELHERGETSFEVEHLRKDGSIVPLAVSVKPITWAGQGAILSVATDITERKAAEEALRTSEARLRLAHAVARMGDWDWNIVTNQLYWAEANYAIHGIDPAVTPTFDAFLAVVDPAERAFVNAAIADALAGKRPFEVDYTAIRPDNGERRTINTRAEVIFDGAGKAVRMVGTVVDITERKRAEAERAKLEIQLAEAQKMELVGRLAGGVAHDFNNMLGVILGNTELALDALGPSSPVRADLLEIQKAARRSADVTRHLLAFARRSIVAPVVLDLNELVPGLLAMMGRLIGEDVELRWLPGTDLWLVTMDPSQVDQVLVNLCLNGRDAIPGVGTITITTANTSVDAAFCAGHLDALPGDYVRLTVSDTGCGMDQNVLGHVFEPFYTTKGVGEGTGLGLATVYGSVRQNGGFVTVSSEPGHGSTFEVHLPRHVGQVAAVVGTGEVALASRGHETILVVEDEPALLLLATRVLEAQGYAVFATSSPREAIHLASEHANEIQLLLTDVVMPEMNGKDLADTLLSRYPALRCMFMSGHPADVISAGGTLDAARSFIEKPFSVGDLVTRVREALDRDLVSSDSPLGSPPGHGRGRAVIPMARQAFAGTDRAAGRRPAPAVLRGSRVNRRPPGSCGSA